MDPSCAGISKRRPQVALSIPTTAFEEASRLCVGMKFENWEHVDLVLLAYKKQIGKFQSKKKETVPSQQRNRKSVKTEYTCFVNICWPLSSPDPTITKLNLTHHGHTLNPDTAIFVNVYRQFPQNVMDKIERWYKKSANLDNVDTFFTHFEVSDKIDNAAMKLTQQLQNDKFIETTLQGLIQQVERSNIIISNDTNNCVVENPLKANTRGRPRKRLKAFIEENSRASNKVTKNSNENYTCRNCNQDGHNSRSCVASCKICQESGHTYLHCSNK
ncbi:15895_t:CDS:2 [Cetraspora pellucida]|uniref:15895_t:CDS:1 n=1 Tax=Cetraspora pellucida TaxID=1433469 RepID=A0ACA9LPP3_9GLOM|nr:15895_t:CDS:2 [Cetraspora pellucida]